MSLSSKKRRQANELLQKPAIHLKFTQNDYPPEPEHSPIVKMTRVELFDIPPQMTKSQKARARKRKRMAARKELEHCEEISESSQKDYSSYPLLHQPVQGSRIAFKVLEMTSAYTPEISDYKVMTMNHNELGSRHCQYSIQSSDASSLDSKRTITGKI
jgi:hypothetical protein